MSFASDLERGEAIERDFLNRVLVAFKKTVQTFGKESRCDIYIPELRAAIEIKYDPKSLETGNIVLEYYHNKPSGLLTTESMHWMIYNGEEEFWLTLEDLVWICSELDPVKIHGPQDAHPKWVYLVPIETIRRISA